MVSRTRTGGKTDEMDNSMVVMETKEVESELIGVDTETNQVNDEMTKGREVVSSLAGLLSLKNNTDLLLLPLTSNMDGKGQSGSVLRQLLSTSQVLFAELERLSRLQAELHSSEDDSKSAVTAPLSGLEELYVGSSAEAELVDAETIWGQVDLQNEALLDSIKKSVRTLRKGIEKSTTKIQLLDLSHVEDEEEKSEVDQTESSSENGDDEDSKSDDDDEEVDEEAMRIRERMEKAMADMDDSGSEDGDDDSNADSDEEIEQDEEIQKQAVNSAEDEDLEDPAADELNDGFFDINEMENFADEEEEYLPDEAYGEEEEEEEESKDETNSKSKKSLHQRLREGDEEGESADDNEDDDLLTEKKNKVRRRRYREDEDIDALYQLYQEPKSDDDDSDEEDEVINLTAAEFFGKPNKRYFGNHKTQKSSASKMGKKVVEDNDADSWDDHDFTEDGADWRDTSNKEEKETMDGSERDEESDQEDANSDEEQDNTDEKESELKTSHAKKSAKLEEQTTALEKELLAEKPWQMTGEAKSTKRPVNSLLESTPEFAVASKIAPTITVEHTSNIEDMIKQRIIAEDWDDVIPRELPDIGRKRDDDLPEVSQEKSKLGLGELYEREYLKKALNYDKNAAEKETSEEKVQSEMKALFASLCSRLDALSNYHFAPRPVADEAEVRTVTTPAIAMEEVLPLHVSDARGVAPEEVYGAKKGRESVLKGESEFDQTERRKLRNAKKSARRKDRQHKLADEKLISRLQPGLGLNNPYEKRKMREELSAARSRGKVTVGEIDTDKDFKTSGKFFKRMQDEVEREVQGGDEASQKKKRRTEEQGQKSSSFKL